ncbi:ABC transporter substrate-binding protein [Clostridium cylindrosporum]|uniref:ABC-type nitrate/sulfonate/bicarbonate transport system, periplasmic component n=1 Tax=Clostridium cylindrosporum DSM 605 TaxID=1121307 RepID=A0A0J8D7M0_CLOCY|nr:ABC transporter substrate-binding protein [Clostridium cylindrosporum]KMT22030.1 ABC-type nitrate/sulfonate/bicarbonate transport system, periplasmic component [Clostridium cylindrosporum DSM 605]
MKKFIVLVIFIALLFTSCGTSNTSSNKESGKKLEEVNLVLDWYPNAIHSFIYAAIENGYFEDEGIKVNIQFPSNATDGLSLVAAGKATLGIDYPSNLIMSKAKENIPVKSVGAVVHSSLSILMSLDEKKIKSPKDLEGKNVGYSGNPLNEEYVRTMVKQDGGDPNKVKFTDVGFEMLSAIMTKRVDSVSGALVNHEVPVLEDKGYKVNYLNPSDYGVPREYTMIFVANDKTINNDREKLEKFMRGAKRGFEFMKKNPDKALEILLKNQQKDNFPLTESVEKKSMKILLPGMDSVEEPFLSQDKKHWEDNAKWLKEKGIIDKIPSSDDLFVNILNK